MLQNFTLGSFAQGVSAGGGAFESIATANGTGSSNTITFSSIPGTYQHLQIRAILKNTHPGDFESILEIRANSDSGSNYSRHRLAGDGASVVAAGAATQSIMSFMSYYPHDGKGGTGTMGALILDIQDYASTSRYKTFRCFGGYDANGTGQVALTSGLWQSTSAITSLTFTNDGAYNWKNTTQFALYGIKGA